MHLFSQYDDHEQNYKPMNDVFFTHFELGYLTSYNILIKPRLKLLFSSSILILEVSNRELQRALD